MSIQRRLSKLEQQSRAAAVTDRQPGVSEEALAEARRVAATCEKWQDLAAYLRTLRKDPEGSIVSIDERQRAQAVTDAFARGLFEEVHSA